MPGSPARLSPSRVNEEANELSKTIDELNNRLNIILLAHRSQESNASHGSRARDETLITLEKQIEATRLGYTKQLDAAIAARDQERTARLLAESTLTDLKRKLDVLKKTHDADADKIHTLEAALSNTQAELAKKNDAFLQVKSSNETLLQQVGTLRKKIESLEKQLENALRDSDGSADQINLWKARAQTAEQGLAALREEYDAIVLRSEREILLLRSNGEGLEHRLRSEFTKQLADMVREKQAISDSEKNQLLESQKNMYEEQIERIRDEYRRRDQELNAIMTRDEELETSNRTLNLKVKEQSEQIRALDNMILALKNENEELQKKPVRSSGRKDQEIFELRMKLEEQEREMRELTEARIRLDKEIETYRALLQEEEARLQHQPTTATSPALAKKRKIEDISYTSVQTVERTASSRTRRNSPQRSALRLVDFKKDHFSVLNTSNGAIDLSGWKVAAENISEVDLPEVLLEPGQAITVHYGPGDADKHNPPQDLFVEGVVIPDTGFKFYLVRPDSKIADGFTARKVFTVGGRRESCSIQ